MSEAHKTMKEIMKRASESLDLLEKGTIYGKGKFYDDIKYLAELTDKEVEELKQTYKNSELIKEFDAIKEQAKKIWLFVEKKEKTGFSLEEQNQIKVFLQNLIL